MFPDWAPYKYIPSFGIQGFPPRVEVSLVEIVRMMTMTLGGLVNLQPHHLKTSSYMYGFGLVPINNHYLIRIGY